MYIYIFTYIHIHLHKYAHPLLSGVRVCRCRGCCSLSVCVCVCVCVCDLRIVLQVGDEMLPTRTTRYTDAVNLFRLSELLVEPPLSGGDGLAFMAPLYSSFQKDGIFREPNLPKHIHSKVFIYLSMYIYIYIYI